MHLCSEESSFQIKYMCPITPSLIILGGLLKCMIKKENKSKIENESEEIEEVSQVASQVFYFLFLMSIFYCCFLKWNENLDEKE